MYHTPKVRHIKINALLFRFYIVNPALLILILQRIPSEYQQKRIPCNPLLSEYLSFLSKNVTHIPYAKDLDPAIFYEYSIRYPIALTLNNESAGA